MGVSQYLQHAAFDRCAHESVLLAAYVTAAQSALPDMKTGAVRGTVFVVDADGGQSLLTGDFSPFVNHWLGGLRLSADHNFTFQAADKDDRNKTKRYAVLGEQS